MLLFSSVSSAAALATKHCNLKKIKKNQANKYVATNFTQNNMEHIIARKTSMFPSHGGLKYLSYQVQYVTINVSPPLYVLLPFFPPSSFIPKETPKVLLLPESCPWFWKSCSCLLISIYSLPGIDAVLVFQSTEWTGFQHRCSASSARPQGVLHWFTFHTSMH